MSSDIQLKQIIFRKTPKSWHPYIKIARLDRPIGIWLLLFPCWWAIALSSGGILHFSAFQWILMLKMLLGATFMRATGCIINDLWDRHIDASVERTKTRPLACGDISISQAFIFMGILLTLSFLILITLSPMAILLGIASLIPIIIYPRMKKITYWPQLFLGLTFNWGALLAWAAITNEISLGAIFLYIAGIFWTLSYDTIYAHQDKEDDALIGIKSTALLFKEKSRFYISIFLILSLIFLAAAKYSISGNPFHILLVILPTLHAFWQAKTWDMDNPKSCLSIFKSNKNYGWLVLLMMSL